MGNSLSELAFQLAQPVVFVAISVCEDERFARIYLSRYDRMATSVGLKYADLPARRVQANSTPPIAVISLNDELFLPSARFT